MDYIDLLLQDADDQDQELCLDIDDDQDHQYELPRSMPVDVAIKRVITR